MFSLVLIMTIIIHLQSLYKKKMKTYKLQFLDQLVGIADYTENDFESSKLLDNIYRYRFSFPMKLELYQLRSKKK